MLPSACTHNKELTANHKGLIILRYLVVRVY
jgi:hypothetical protein